MGLGREIEIVTPCLYIRRETGRKTVIFLAVGMSHK